MPMKTIHQYVPVTRAKTMLLDLVRKIKDSDETIAITKNGVPEVVLISMNTCLLYTSPSPRDRS